MAIPNSYQKLSNLFIGGQTWNLQYDCYVSLGQQSFFSLLVHIPSKLG